MIDRSAEREEMIRRHIAGRGIDDPAILEAFRQVPREFFVSADHADHAYDDYPLPIESGQTISQPYIVAFMIEAAEIMPGDTVLEVGAGSGYAAAIISRIAARVVGIERHPELAAIAAGRMARLGFDNVRIIEGDGTRGCSEEAPFDVILAAASGSHVPQPLIDQLAPRGRLVMPIGRQSSVQQLVKLVKRDDGEVERDALCAVRFVPLIGAEGWEE